MSKHKAIPTEAINQVEPLIGQRQKSESDKAITAFNDWLRLGSGRTLSQLLQKYTDAPQNSPTQSLDTLKAWSKSFDWAMRASEFDASWEARKNAEREQVLGYGLAHTYERVRKLYRLADLLESQIYERGEFGVLHNLWLPDVKAIGSGEYAERVDIERFNSPILEQYRKVLEDIAKEVGGRVQKQEINFNISIELVARTVQALEQAGIDPAQAFEALINKAKAKISAGD